MMMIWVHSFFYDLMDSENDECGINQNIIVIVCLDQLRNDKGIIMKICRDKTGFYDANNNSNYDAFINIMLVKYPTQ